MDKILSYIVAVLLVAMSAVVFGNVFSRYFLNTTWGWYEEVSRFPAHLDRLSGGRRLP